LLRHGVVPAGRLPGSPTAHLAQGFPSGVDALIKESATQYRQIGDGPVHTKKYGFRLNTPDKARNRKKYLVKRRALTHKVIGACSNPPAIAQDAN
jgi:hypothetical protein